MRLANKIALVTGAGSGIGRGIAHRFAIEGALLVLSDIAEGGLRETAALIDEALAAHAGQAEGTDPTTDGFLWSPWGSFVVGDVSVREYAERMVEAAITRWGRLDIVLTNAGISGSRRCILARTHPAEQWERRMETTLTVGCR